MSVTYTDNTAKIEADITQKSSLFLRLMTNEVIKISTPKTPKKTGRLRNDVLKRVLGLRGKIVWGKKYAIYQESKQYQNYTTPGTGSGFAKNSVSEAISLTSKILRMAGL